MRKFFFRVFWFVPAAAGAAALVPGLARDLAGETQPERARQHAAACTGEHHTDQQIHGRVSGEKYNGIRRGC